MEMFVIFFLSWIGIVNSKHFIIETENSNGREPLSGPRTLEDKEAAGKGDDNNVIGTTERILPPGVIDYGKFDFNFIKNPPILEYGSRSSGDDYNDKFMTADKGLFPNLENIYRATEATKGDDYNVIGAQQPKRLIRNDKFDIITLPNPDSITKGDDYNVIGAQQPKHLIQNDKSDYNPSGHQIIGLPNPDPYNLYDQGEEYKGKRDGKKQKGKESQVGGSKKENRRDLMFN